MDKKSLVFQVLRQSAPDTRTIVGDSAPSEILRATLSRPPARPEAAPQTTSSQPAGNEKGTGKSTNTRQ
jgi:hypothetical protein